MIMSVFVSALTHVYVTCVPDVILTTRKISQPKASDTHTTPGKREKRGEERRGEERRGEERRGEERRGEERRGKEN